MFSSADGYCSAVVFSDGELGIKYEKQPEPVQEYDVEMVDIPDTKAAVVAVQQQPQQPKKRIVHQLTSAADVIEKPKKRRITPILISTPFT